MHPFELIYNDVPQDFFIGMFFLYRPDRRVSYQVEVTQVEEAIQTANKYAADGYDVYFSPAPMHTRPEERRRGSKALYAGSNCLWVDVDSSSTRTKDSIIREMESFSFKPSIVVDSGHGVHAYWILTEFTDDWERVERCNLWLAEQFRADHCHSIDHLLRVPDTFNYKHPDDVVPVQVLWCEPDGWDIGVFGELVPRAEDELPDIEPQPLPETFLEDLPPKLRKRIEEGTGQDRSANDFYIASQLLRREFTPGQVLTVFLSPTWISGSKTQEKGIAYAIKTITSAMAKAEGGLEKVDSFSSLVESLHWEETERGPRRRVEVQPEAAFTIPCLKWLADNGLSYLRDARTGDGYLFTNGQIIRADKDDRQLKDYIYDIANVTETSWDSRKLREALAHQARINGRDVLLHPWITFDPLTLKGYIYPNARKGTLLTVGPDSIVDGVANGLDGFLLKPSVLSVPFEFDSAVDKVMGIRSLVESVTGQFACPRDVQVLLTCYLLTIPLQRFASDDLLPILHVTGPSGGGKSWALKLMTSWFYGRQLLLRSTQASSYAISDSDPFIGLDDYETLDADWQGRLLTGATGLVRTKMGSSGEGTPILQGGTTIFALTSINPLPSETLRRRAIVVEVDSKKFHGENFNATTAISEILNNRNATWSAYVKLLSEDVLPTMVGGSAKDNIATVREGIRVSQNESLATYLSLMYIVGQCINRYVPGFLETDLAETTAIWGEALQLQSMEEFVERDALVQYCDLVIEMLQATGGDYSLASGIAVSAVTEGGNLVGFQGTGSELHASFGAACKNFGLRYDLPNPNAVGRRFQLSRLLLEQAGLQVKPYTKGPRRGWQVVKIGDKK